MKNPGPNLKKFMQKHGLPDLIEQRDSPRGMVPDHGALKGAPKMDDEALDHMRGEHGMGPEEDEGDEFGLEDEDEAPRSWK